MTDQPQPLDLDAIEARANNATPGPWSLDYESCECNDGMCRDADYVGAVITPEQLPAAAEVAARTGKPLGPYAYHRNEIADFTTADLEFITHARTDAPALVAEIRRLTAELQQARGLLDDVLTVCDATESGARRWENPLPVPEWVSIVRAAADGSNYPAAEKTAHDPIECDHQAEAGQLAEQVKQLRAALHSIESDAERAARKGYDLDTEDIRTTARNALNPAALSGA